MGGQVKNDNTVNTETIYNEEGEDNDDGNAFYMLIMALIAIIIATLCCLMWCLCYFYKKQRKSKQKGMQTVKQFDSISMSPQMSTKMSTQSFEIQSKEIQISIKTTPSLDIMSVTSSPVIDDALFLDHLKAPSSIELEGRMKKMSHSELYDEVADSDVQTTKGTPKLLNHAHSVDVDEILLQRDDNNVNDEGSEEEQEQDEDDDMYALPEITSTRDDTKK